MKVFCFVGIASVALLALLAAACGSSSSPKATTSPVAYAPTIVPAKFTDHITNRYFPLTPGTTYVYDGTKDGVAQHNEVTVTHDSKTVVGVKCVVVHDVVTQEGKLHEETFDWYAQDDAGNVWYFGEDSKEYENGAVTSTKGSWEAGVDGAQPGIVMEGVPRVGDTYRQEYYAGEAEDMAKVLSVGESKTVPAGSYQDVVITEDFTALEPDRVEHKYFAPGVGFISGTRVKGSPEQIDLVRITTE